MFQLFLILFIHYIVTIGTNDPFFKNSPSPAIGPYHPFFTSLQRSYQLIGIPLPSEIIWLRFYMGTIHQP